MSPYFRFTEVQWSKTPIGGDLPKSAQDSVRNVYLSKSPKKYGIGRCDYDSQPIPPTQQGHLTQVGNVHHELKTYNTVNLGRVEILLICWIIR